MYLINCALRKYDEKYDLSEESQNSEREAYTEALHRFRCNGKLRRDVRAR